MKVLLEAKGLEYVTFSGIEFSYATWLHPSTNDGLPDIQAGCHFLGNPDMDSWVESPANIIFRRSSHIVLQVCSHSLSPPPPCPTYGINNKNRRIACLSIWAQQGWLLLKLVSISRSSKTSSPIYPVVPFKLGKLLTPLRYLSLSHTHNNTHIAHMCLSISAESRRIQWPYGYLPKPYQECCSRV